MIWVVRCGGYSREFDDYASAYYYARINFGMSGYEIIRKDEEQVQ